MHLRGGGAVRRGEAAERVVARVAAGTPVRLEGRRAVLPVGADRAALMVSSSRKAAGRWMPWSEAPRSTGRSRRR